MEKLLIFSLLGFQLVLNAGTQIILKNGVTALSNAEQSGVFCLIMRAMGNIHIIGGIFCYVCSFIIWLYLLSKLEVSYLYPMGSVSYVLAAVAGYVFFQEHMSLLRVAGIVTIMFGVFLIAKS